MKICYIETAYDQYKLINQLFNACKKLNYDFVLLLSDHNLNDIYKSIGCEIKILDVDKKLDTYSSKKAYFLERKTRFIQWKVLKRAESSIKSLINNINANFYLSYVGPESIKYMTKQICENNSSNFYFLDQTQSGYKTICNSPYSVSGDVINDISSKENPHVPFLNRYNKLEIKILPALKFSVQRFLEAVLSTITRLIKKYYFKVNFSKSINLNSSEVILAPQSNTEAAYTYGTLSIESPLKQLYEWSLKNPNNSYRWRLHPISYMRMEFKDFLIMKNSGYKVEKLFIPLKISFSNCKYVVSLNSNILFDSSVFETSSISIGKSYFKLNKKNNTPSKLSTDEILYLNKKTGLGSKEWDFNTFVNLIKTISFK
jgi:hypothetical protein